MDISRDPRCKFSGNSGSNQVIRIITKMWDKGKGLVWVRPQEVMFASPAILRDPSAILHGTVCISPNLVKTISGNNTGKPNP